MSRTHRSRKIFPPTLPSSILHRQSLVSALNNAFLEDSSATFHCKLVLLCAPAGYGKTTLLADFAKHSNITCCWYMLDNTDADKITFLRTLIESIRLRFPDFGTALDQVLDNIVAAEASSNAATYYYEAVIDEIVASLENEIAERMAMVLCNYHELHANQLISKLVDRLLTALPPHCVVIIESRAIPNLSLMPLIVQRQVFVLGSNGLRFTNQDIRDLANLQGFTAPSEAEAEFLTEAFGGWIAGILLGTRLGNIQFPTAQIPTQTYQGALTINPYQHNLFEYVVKEVFKNETEIYTFLKEASILQQMTPSICSTLLDCPDAAKHLTYLEQHGLFVTRSDNGTEASYTLHTVMSELLRDELKRQSQDRFVELHTRAAQIFQTAQEYDRAIYHALEAKAHHLTASLITAASQSLLAKGQIETLAHWIDALPNEAVRYHPRLLIIRAKIYLMLGEYTNALPLLSTASEILTQPSSVVDADEIPLLQGEIGIAQGKALFQLGEYQQAQILSQQVLERLPVDEVTLRAAAHLRLGVCANLLGDFTTGVAELQKALQLWGRHAQVRETADLHSALVSAYSLLGNFALAEHHLSRAIRIQEHLNDTWCQVDNSIRMGLLKWRQGRFAESETAYQQALTLARGTIHFQRGEAYALVNSGKLYQDQDLYHEALTVSEDGLELAQKLKDIYLINSALRTLAITYVLMGDPQTALVFASKMDQLATDIKEESYDGALWEFTRGTILLYQGQYAEALESIERAEVALISIGLKTEQLQAHLRAAACHIALGSTAEVIRRIGQISEVIAHYSYEHIVMIELRRLPELKRQIQSLPEAAYLRNLLNMEEKIPVGLSWQLPPPEKQSTIAAVAETPLIAMTTNHPQLKIYALGEPSLFLGDAPITRWRMARSMELFFLLLDSNTPMRKEQLITALWPDADDQIDQTWRSTLYYLRKTLGVSCVLKHAGTYTLNLASLYGENTWYDVALFQDLKTQAFQAVDAEEEEAAYTAFLQMIGLYRGDYAQSFYSDWCSFRRDELRQSYIDARHQLALITWRKEEFDESVTHWQHMLAVDNCIEEAHYGLMRCYLRQDKRSLALRQYQRCVTTLHDELGVAPGKAIQQLYQRMINHTKS